MVLHNEKKYKERPLDVLFFCAHLQIKGIKPLEAMSYVHIEAINGSL